MNRKLLLLLAWLALLPAAAQKADFNVVPLPREITADPNAGAFVINQNTAILDGRTAGEKRNARFLQQYLFERTGFQLPLLKKAKGVPTLSVRTLADAKELGTEGYRIDVDARQITITAPTMRVHSTASKHCAKRFHTWTPDKKGKRPSAFRPRM